MVIKNIQNISQFVAICAQLVNQGVTFEACADSFTIVLTGGY